MSSGSESAQTTSTTSTTSPRRRSSGFMPAFESLQQQKRANSDARRQSMNDQHSRPGFFGKMFHETFGRNAK